ncbi:hypothetical protein [Idiomarina sp.]|uniref:hypothetical protein n=1 Tax=Idiomarina sp. TaxID=1874361 RepID=UPI003A900F5A
MAKFNLKQINDTIKERAKIISNFGRKIPNEFVIGVVAWFGHELKTSLNGFHYDVSDEPSSGGSGRIDIRGQQVGSPARLLLSNEMRQMFVHMANEGKLDQDELIETVDNFIVHEIVHRCQGMGEQNHRGLSTLAPNILHEIDYEADASAVIIIFVLRLLELQERKALPIHVNETWPIYSKLIKGVIYQMQLFNLLEEGAGSQDNRLLTNEEVKHRVISFTRWERLCVWHFQYHRALCFNQRSYIRDFQILFKPAISFRNQYEASNNFLDADWPDNEFEFVEKERMKNTRHLSMFCLSSINCWGIRQHAHASPPIDQALALFSGLFTADVAESEKFFLPIFHKHGFLIGDGRDISPLPDDGGPGGGIAPANDKTEGRENTEQDDAMIAGIESYLQQSPYQRVIAQKDDMDAFQVAAFMILGEPKRDRAIKQIVVGLDEEQKKPSSGDSTNVKKEMKG